MALGKLTQKSITAAAPGMHGDGGGLWLQVRPSGRSWLFRYKSPVTGKAREMGLGPAVDVSVLQARDAATLCRATLREGKDPLEQRKASAAEQATTVPTFRAAAAAYIAAHRSGWRNARHAQQWGATLEQHAFVVLGAVPVSAVDTAAVLKVLTPIWSTIPETASRVRGRIELILDFAKANGWRSGENPATWRGHLSHTLPRRSKLAPVIHHAALPYKDTPRVMTALARSRGASGLAVRFAALTAARSGEVRGATWVEIDRDAAVWTIPAGRMKSGIEHRVPLSAAAMDVLTEAQAAGDALGGTNYVFPGGRAGKPLWDAALARTLQLAAGDDSVTVHGLRSTFRDWCSERTAFPAEVAEAALAHAVRDKVEAAYRRGALLEKRRKLMDAWGAYCIASPASKVVPLRA